MRKRTMYPVSWATDAPKLRPTTQCQVPACEVGGENSGMQGSADRSPVHTLHLRLQVPLHNCGYVLLHLVGLESKVCLTKGKLLHLQRHISIGDIRCVEHDFLPVFRHGREGGRLGEGAAVYTPLCGV